MKNNKNIQEQTLEFHTALSRFSHEIRNPLSLLNSELQRLSSSHPELAELPEWENIMENLAYIQELLNEFSWYSNAQRLTFTPTDLNKYLPAVIHTYQSTLDYLGIACKTNFAPNLPVLSIDRIKLRQALLNLMRNAQESITHSHGEISISAVLEENKQLCICVSDNGCGIDPALIPKLCTPFVTHKENGTGLGLAITKQIIQAHHGHLEITSTPGSGTCIRLFLPLPNQ